LDLFSSLIKYRPTTYYYYTGHCGRFATCQTTACCARTAQYTLALSADTTAGRKLRRTLVEHEVRILNEGNPGDSLGPAAMKRMKELLPAFDNKRLRDLVNGRVRAIFGNARRFTNPQVPWPEALLVDMRKCLSKFGASEGSKQVDMQDHTRNTAQIYRKMWEWVCACVHVGACVRVCALGMVVRNSRKLTNTKNTHAH
jgi:hypothetical protein